MSRRIPSWATTMTQGSPPAPPDPESVGPAPRSEPSRTGDGSDRGDVARRAVPRCSRIRWAAADARCDALASDSPPGGWWRVGVDPPCGELLRPAVSHLRLGASLPLAVSELHESGIGNERYLTVECGPDGAGGRCRSIEWRVPGPPGLIGWDRRASVPAGPGQSAGYRGRLCLTDVGQGWVGTPLESVLGQPGRLSVPDQDQGRVAAIAIIAALDVALPRPGRH